MTDQAVRCPGCVTVWAARAEWIEPGGVAITCPLCKHEFVVFPEHDTPGPGARPLPEGAVDAVSDLAPTEMLEPPPLGPAPRDRPVLLHHRDDPFEREMEPVDLSDSLIPPRRPPAPRNGPRNVLYEPSVSTRAPVPAPAIWPLALGAAFAVGFLVAVVCMGVAALAIDAVRSRPAPVPISAPGAPG